MSTIEVLLETVSVLKQIESIASGAAITPSKQTPQDKLWVCGFLAKSQAGDLSIMIDKLAQEAQAAARECATMTQPQPAPKRTTKRK